MDVYFTKLGIQLSFGKTSEFGEGGVVEPPPQIIPRYANGFHPFLLNLTKCLVEAPSVGLLRRPQNMSHELRNGEIFS
jgi:hypothetical protein